MSAPLNASPGGHPSSTAPSAGPWLSPQVVIRNTRPKVFQLMGPSSFPIRRALSMPRARGKKSFSYSDAKRQDGGHETGRGNPGDPEKRNVSPCPP